MRSGRWLGVHGPVRRKWLQTQWASSVGGINNKLRIIARNLLDVGQDLDLGLEAVDFALPVGKLPVR